MVKETMAMRATSGVMVGTDVLEVEVAQEIPQETVIPHAIQVEVEVMVGQMEAMASY